ncbi:hypothetical protein SteCoe_38233 [Stentor coeruleus]|uniref:Uncharacterized protein n=1 Tax=Stentor coeruleus TaxID=5963 RepID=A0A1R2ALL8_9CILI|nr:hypothetical protein SteCoe_38233 [Stentor coeruleus]
MNLQFRREKIVVSCPKLNQNIIRLLIPLKPKCASKLFKAEILNIDKAYQEIQETQSKFLEAREKIRQKLNFTPTYKEKYSEKEFFNAKSSLFTHENYFGKTVKKSINIKRRSLTRSRRYYNITPERVRNIDTFIDRCEDVKIENKIIFSKISKLKNSLDRNFKKITDSVKVENDESNKEFNKSLKSIHKEMIKMFEKNAK